MGLISIDTEMERSCNVPSTATPVAWISNVNTPEQSTGALLRDSNAGYYRSSLTSSGHCPTTDLASYSLGPGSGSQGTIMYCTYPSAAQLTSTTHYCDYTPNGLLSVDYDEGFCPSTAGASCITATSTTPTSTSTRSTTTTTRSTTTTTRSTTTTTQSTTSTPRPTSISTARTTTTVTAQVTTRSTTTQLTTAQLTTELTTTRLTTQVATETSTRRFTAEVTQAITPTASASSNSATGPWETTPAALNAASRSRSNTAASAAGSSIACIILLAGDFITYVLYSPKRTNRPRIDLTSSDDLSMTATLLPPQPATHGAGIPGERQPLYTTSTPQNVYPSGSDYSASPLPNPYMNMSSSPQPFNGSISTPPPAPPYDPPGSLPNPYSNTGAASQPFGAHVSDAYNTGSPYHSGNLPPSRMRQFTF